MNLQTLVKQTLEGDAKLNTLGLSSEHSVFQADTLDSPDSKPFIVVRWLDAQAGSGPVKRRPFTLWIYDDEGDYTRAKKIALRSCAVLIAVPQTKLDDGWLIQFDDREMGAELADPGWQAVVVPYNMAAIASGS